MYRRVSHVGQKMVLRTVLFVSVYLDHDLVPEQEIDLAAVDNPTMFEGDVIRLQDFVNYPFLLRGLMCKNVVSHFPVGPPRRLENG